VDPPERQERDVGVALFRRGIARVAGTSVPERPARVSANHASQTHAAPSTSDNSEFKGCTRKCWATTVELIAASSW
jgi:hypothetical protein